jgi:hypothetical protein
MEGKSWSITAAHGLIILNATFWLIFSVVSALGLLPGVLSSGPLRWVMAVLSLGTAFVFGVLVILLIRRKKWAYYLILILLGLIAILSIMDEVGVLDIFTSLISLGAILLLIKDHAWYQNPTSPNNDNA